LNALQYWRFFKKKSQKNAKISQKGYVMNIQLNGENQEIAASTIAELIAELKLETRMIAVEKNMEVVAKSTYANTVIQADDRIEIVHMIGGG